MTNTTIQDATKEMMAWMAGDWQGDTKSPIGSGLVEETWTSPRLGAMEAMIRVTDPEKILMIEMISIREVSKTDDSRTLTLTFLRMDNALNNPLSWEMSLQDSGEGFISFLSNDAEINMQQLHYTRQDDGRLGVDVTIKDGTVFPMRLQRK